MKEILVFRHVPHEHLGAIARLMADHALVPRLVDLFANPTVPPIGDAAGLIVLGGPMNVDDVDRFPFLAAEIEVIREMVAADRPILGVCLGSQLLAKALGARVYANPNGKEIGWLPITPLPQAMADPLFRCLRLWEVVFHWHGDIFDLPPGAIPLARSDRTDCQAFRFGDHAYGLLFHLEVSAVQIAEWLAHREMRAEAEGAGLSPEVIHQDTAIYLPRLAELRTSVLGRFLDFFK